ADSAWRYPGEILLPDRALLDPGYNSQITRERAQRRQLIRALAAEFVMHAAADDPHRVVHIKTAREGASIGVSLINSRILSESGIKAFCFDRPTWIESKFCANTTDGPNFRRTEIVDISTERPDYGVLGLAIGEPSGRIDQHIVKCQSYATTDCTEPGHRVVDLPVGSAWTDQIQKSGRLLHAEIVEVRFQADYSITDLQIVADLAASNESVRRFINEHAADAVNGTIQIIPHGRAARIAGIESGVKARRQRRSHGPFRRQSQIGSLRGIRRDQRNSRSGSKQRSFHDAVLQPVAHASARVPEYKARGAVMRVARHPRRVSFFCGALHEKH